MNEHARDRFITGLLQELPPAGQMMPYARRRKWLDAVRSILDLLYSDEDEGASPSADQGAEPGTDSKGNSEGIGLWERS